MVIYGSKLFDAVESKSRTTKCIPQFALIHCLGLLDRFTRLNAIRKLLPIGNYMGSVNARFIRRLAERVGVSSEIGHATSFLNEISIASTHSLGALILNLSADPIRPTKSDNLYFSALSSL